MIHKYYHRYRNSDGSCQNTAYKNIKCFRPSFHILKDLAFLILSAKTCFTHDHCISVKNTFEVKCSAIFKLQHSRVDRQRDQCSDAVFSVITFRLHCVLPIPSVSYTYNTLCTANSTFCTAPVFIHRCRFYFATSKLLNKHKNVCVTLLLPPVRLKLMCSSVLLLKSRIWLLLYYIC